MVSNIVLYETLGLLEQKGCLRILIRLLESQHALNISELMKTPGLGQNAVYNSINKLEDLELIHVFRDRYNSRNFELTDKGRRIAELVKQIQEELVKED